MKHTHFKAHILRTLLLLLLTVTAPLHAALAQSTATDTAATAASTEQIETQLAADDDEMAAEDGAADSGSFYQLLKTKFIEGTPAFMSLVAIVLIVGLTLCIERMLHLTTLQTSTADAMQELEQSLADGGDIPQPTEADGSQPVASLVLQARRHADADAATLERLLTTEGTRQTALLEKGCSWIALCIRLAPSLGFLGTVIGMVMAFDRIEAAGDISPTLIAGGMKVALITTIFGIITALILQVFYNMILNRIQQLVGTMEQASTLLVEHRSRTRNH